MDEKAKELLEKAKLTAGMAAGAVTQKGGRLVEQTRRNLQVFDLNNKVELLMRDIGRMVYLTHTGVETDEAALEEKLAQIDETYAQIAAIKEELEAQKTTNPCPVCGKDCAKADLYCRVCGEKLQ